MTRTAARLKLTLQYRVGAASLPSPSLLRRWLRGTATRDANVTLRFVGSREGTRLNARYRGKAYATNVLTFVYDDVSPLAGDLVLCTPVLRREAKAQGKTLADHCAHLVVHGMLHLLGYDHQSAAMARVMEARERSLLAGWGVPDPYAEPYRGRSAATSDGGNTTAKRARKRTA